MAETKEVVPAQVTEIENESGKIVSVAELAKQFETAEVGTAIGADYFTIEPGEEARLLFVEMTEMNGMGADKDKMIDAVKLFDPKDGRFKINADKVVVSACKSLAAKDRSNVAIQITCTGMTKSKNGFKYKDFTINELLVKASK